MESLLVVTGASRGLGQAIAIAFSKALIADGSVKVVLVARSEKGLEETRQAIVSQSPAETVAKSLTMDLSDLELLDEHLDTIFQEIQPLSSYKRLILINNAGSLGHLGKASNQSSLKDLRSYIDFNVTSSLWVSTRFCKVWSEALAAAASNNDGTSTATMVNISSLCAVQPFPTMAGYCAGKAARDLYHAVLAKEEEEGDNTTRTRVLNYAPGALETDMTTTLRACDELEPNLRQFFQSSHEKGDLIPPERTADKLVKLVLSGDFESGSHIDYWDLDDDGRLQTTTTQKQE